MLSCSIDFYVRIFVRVYTSAAVVKDSATKLAYLWQSSGCDSFHLQPVGRKVSTCLLTTTLLHACVGREQKGVMDRPKAH